MRAALFLSALLLAGSAWANIGSVTESTGVAVIKRGKETITIAKGTVVETNDKVETKNGKVKIVFKDDTNVTVTESSSLIIDDFVYDPKSGAGKLGLKATAGAVRYVSGAIAKDPKNVKINTPTAAITVRGTDFVMAVNETGGSMIMLMPTCEIEQGINLKGLTCGSGAIDVETPAGIVKMNRPYQATIVETAGAAPLPPITVNLGGAPIGTNLLISPPRTVGGLSIMAAARAAAERTGDARRNDKKDEKDDKDDAKDGEKQHVASKQNDDKQRQNSQQPRETTTRVEAIDTRKLDIAVGDVGTENPNVKKLWKDKSETQQVGWQYESLSSSGNNYANINLTMDTKALVIVTQDRVVDAFNFNTQSTKSYGLIVVNQTYR
jgi:hypothetical protein